MNLVNLFQDEDRYYNSKTLKIVMRSQITAQRGTQVLELEVGLPNWAGELFIVYQEKMMATLPSNMIINTKRGTVGIKASEYPKSIRKLPSRLRISSARGTAIRSL